jgi:methylenetetrahydrofolate reductase (NADPH)
MKITDLFLSQEKTYSFEFFPPKDEISAVDFGINIGRLMKLSPSFVTVTYGAGGSTQERTFALVDYLQNKIGLTTVAHYTCVNATHEKVKADLNKLVDFSIQNLMLLRGDPPEGQTKFVASQNGFNHASELIEFVDANYDFCKAGAAYVEKHPESKDLKEEIRNLKIKVNAGADFLITQLFFINKLYFQFIDLARQSGITCRIIPGIIPLTSYNQIERFTNMSSAKIPFELLDQMEKYKNDHEKMYEIGVEYSIKQCQELLQKGAPGIHFYTLNKSRAAVEIFESL